jgi:hypothetical protein
VVYTELENVVPDEMYSIRDTIIELKANKEWHESPKDEMNNDVTLEDKSAHFAVQATFTVAVDKAIQTETAREPMENRKEADNDYMDPVLEWFQDFPAGTSSRGRPIGVAPPTPSFPKGRDLGADRKTQDGSKDEVEPVLVFREVPDPDSPRHPADPMPPIPPWAKDTVDR